MVLLHHVMCFGVCVCATVWFYFFLFGAKDNQMRDLQKEILDMKKMQAEMQVSLSHMCMWTSSIMHFTLPFQE